MIIRLKGWNCVRVRDKFYEPMYCRKFSGDREVYKIINKIKYTMDGNKK